MDPKLVQKPHIILQKMPFPLTIKKEVDAEIVDNDIFNDRVRCHYCTDTFTRIAARNRHEAGHEGKRRFQCTQCEKSYSRAEHLRRHENSHAGIKAFKCDGCEKRFACASKLRRHEIIHTGVKAFKCDDCEKRYVYKSELAQHRRTHTNERPYKCTQCDMAFRQYGHLKQHCRQHSVRSADKQKSNGCEKDSTFSSFLVEHQRAHVRPLESIDSEQTGHIQAHTRQRKVCQQSFRYDETPQFACSSCDKVLMCKRSLQSHIRIAHTGEKPYKCKYCDKTFASRQKCFYHRRSQHEDTCFECPDCGRRFAAFWMMKKHSLLHETGSDYVCPECGKCFRQALYLKSHVQCHGEAQNCDVCGRLLPNPLRLRNHLKCHLLPKVRRLISRRKVFDCGKCGKQFAKRNLVVKHFTAVHANVVKQKSSVKAE